MRVAPLTSPAQAPAPAAKPARVEVEPMRTRASMGEMRGAIDSAYRSLYGRAPTKATLDTLTAQAALETGRGEHMFNFNFGGIKGTSPTGETARYRTREVVDGQSIHITDGFRAYRSLEDGAKDFVSLLSRRYAGALERADRGDVRGYAESLRSSGYYTAPVDEYALGLTRLVGELGGTSTSAPSQPSITPRITDRAAIEALPTVASLDRFIDALSVDVARLAAPLEEDDSYG